MTETFARFVGYWPSLHTPRVEYQDFMRMRRMTVEELVAGCRLNIFPVGLVVEVRGRQFQILPPMKHDWQTLWEIGRKV